MYTNYTIGIHYIIIYALYGIRYTCSIIIQLWCKVKPIIYETNFILICLYIFYIYIYRQTFYIIRTIIYKIIILQIAVQVSILHNIT